MNIYTGQRDISRTDDSLKEKIAHEDLTDMADTGGTNTDHDLRYVSRTLSMVHLKKHSML